MKTPESIVPHAPDYNPDAWQEYEISELGQWVHLLVKRARMRANPEKRAKDLQDAENYLEMIRAHVDAAKVEGA